MSAGRRRRVVPPSPPSTHHIRARGDGTRECDGTRIGTDRDAFEVWAGSQDGLGSRAFCAKIAGIPLDKVTFHLFPSGGSFGRRLPGLLNFLEYAVQTAKALPGVPVKLIFTREQDMRHDYYRPNVTSRFKATLRPDGMPDSWQNHYTAVEDALAAAHTIVYDVPNQTYRAIKVEKTPVPTGPTRSVEFSLHNFIIESIVYVLANQAVQDPFEYRRALLKHKPRHLAILELAAARSGWGTPLARRGARAGLRCWRASGPSWHTSRKWKLRMTAP